MLCSNYQQIQSLAHDQHEIATETISLQQGLQDKGYEEWVGEMIGMREILRHFANVSTNDVVGMRAPYLKPGRNTQYKVSSKYIRRLKRFPFHTQFFGRLSRTSATFTIVRLPLNRRQCPFGHTHSTTKYRMNAKVARVRIAFSQAYGKCQ